MTGYTLSGKKEDWFNSVESEELLANAIHDCKQMDEEAGRKSNTIMGAWVMLTLITFMVGSKLLSDTK